MINKNIGTSFLSPDETTSSALRVADEGGFECIGKSLRNTGSISKNYTPQRSIEVSRKASI